MRQKRTYEVRRTEMLERKSNEALELLRDSRMEEYGYEHEATSSNQSGNIIITISDGRVLHDVIVGHGGMREANIEAIIHIETDIIRKCNA